MTLNLRESDLNNRSVYGERRGVVDYPGSGTPSTVRIAQGEEPHCGALQRPLRSHLMPNNLRGKARCLSAYDRFFDIGFRHVDACHRSFENPFDMSIRAIEASK